MRDAAGRFGTSSCTNTDNPKAFLLPLLEVQRLETNESRDALRLRLQTSFQILPLRWFE